jgi:chemotaxis protein MotB
VRRRRRVARRPHHDRWLVSYADFITLLFAFFVVMYSAAQLDKRRLGELAIAIQAAFDQRGPIPPRSPTVGGLSQPLMSALPAANLRPDDLSQVRRRIENELSKEMGTGDVAVRRTPEGLVISLREIGFFDSGSDEIKPGAQPAFARLANVLRQSGGDIRVEGHTDNVPIHTARFHSNWDLSTARSTATVRMLIQKYHLSAARLSASGYAEFRPVAENNTAVGRATNRRVDIVIPIKFNRP